jgi:hypothetical protein
MSLQDLSFPIDVSLKLIAKSRHLLACAANPFRNARWRSSVPVFACIFLFSLAAASSARADGTCTALLATKFKEAQAKNQFYNIQLSIHREDIKLVTYSAGDLAPNQDGGFIGRANQLFSDRRAISQPFNINAADQLDLRLSATGVLRVHYNPWNFDTAWDLSCSGSMLTKYLPGFGVVTLTFRDLFTPIQ